MKDKYFTPVPDVKEGKKIAIFTLGPPGSGKSTVIDKVLALLNIEKDHIVQIDPDSLRGEMADYRALLRAL